jgi:hypothetical protein
MSTKCQLEIVVFAPFSFWRSCGVLDCWTSKKRNSGLVGYGFRELYRLYKPCPQTEALILHTRNIYRIRKSSTPFDSLSTRAAIE